MKVSREKGIALLNRLLFAPQSQRQYWRPLTSPEKEIADRLVHEGLLQKDAKKRSGYSIRLELRRRARKEMQSAAVWGGWKIREDFSDPKLIAQVIEFFDTRGGPGTYLSMEVRDGWFVHTSNGTYHSDDLVKFRFLEGLTAGPKAGRNVTGHYLSPS